MAGSSVASALEESVADDGCRAKCTGPMHSEWTGSLALQSVLGAVGVVQKQKQSAESGTLYGHLEHPESYRGSLTVLSTE